VSGFCAIHSWREACSDQFLLADMTAAMSHRGSDSTSLLHPPFVAGMTRLNPPSEHPRDVSITPHSSIWVAGDVRLDNREELLHALRAHGLPADRTDDVDLIADAYAVWKEECVQHLLGDYAFVIWDERRQQLFGARDPMGMRPFVYHYDCPRLLCASEPRQLLKDPTVSNTLNDTWISYWLTSGIGHWRETPFQSIRQLPPGHYLLCDRDGLRIGQYWNPNPTSTLNYSAQADYDEHFRTLFVDAVRCRLRDHQPPFLDLSGGLDSSSVVCAAAEFWKTEGRASRINCFHAYSNKYLEVNERRYAELVAQDYPSIELHCLSRDDSLALDGAWEPRTYTNAPSVSSLIFPQFRRRKWELARQLGSKVYISGCFGDGLLSGNHAYLSEYLHDLNFPELRREVRNWERSLGVPGTRILYHWAILPWLKQCYEAERRRVQGPWLRDSVWTRSRRCSIQDRNILRKMCRNPLARQVVAGLLRHADCVTLQGDDVLAAGLETREPFLDRRLVEFVLAVPPQFQIMPGESKSLLRNAMRGLLPEPVRTRRDKGRVARLTLFGVAKHREQLKGLVRQMPAILSPYVDSARLAEAIDRVSQGDSVHDPSFFAAIALVLWSHRLPGTGGALPVV
jgi:asparagine synthase (glutamine-hydrolysing)